MSDPVEMTMDEIQAAARARMDVVREQIDAIKAQTAEKRALREQLAAEASAINARINLLSEEIAAVEYPVVFELKKELGKLARAAGGY